MAGTLKDYTRWIKNEKNSLRPPHQKKKRKKKNYIVALSALCIESKFTEVILTAAF